MLQSFARFSALALLLFITYATLSPITLRPDSGHLHPERVLAFVALGGALSCAFPRRWGRTLVLAVILPMALELAQTLVPTRHGRLADAEEKAVGAALGAMLGGVLTWSLERFSARSRRRV